MESMTLSRTDRRTFDRVVHGVRAALRGSDVVEVTKEPSTFAVRTDGQYVVVARTACENLPIEVWYDSYLDESQPRRFSIWLFSASARQIDAAARRSRWSKLPTRKWAHRRRGGRATLRERPGAQWAGRAFIDAWPGFGYYFGRYVPVRASHDPIATLAHDARVLATLVRSAGDRGREQLTRLRAGQDAFRNRLLDQYGGRCTVSGCNVTVALEAAHIEPFARKQSHDVSNGLVLRADLHALFDRGFLTIAADGRVRLAAFVRRDRDYARLHGVRVDLTRAQHAALRRRGTG